MGLMMKLMFSLINWIMRQRPSSASLQMTLSWWKELCMLEVCTPIQRKLDKLDKLSTSTSSAAMENMESFQERGWSSWRKIYLQEITNWLKLTLWREYWVTESLWNFQKEEKVQEIWVKSILYSPLFRVEILEWKIFSEHSLGNHNTIWLQGCFF